MSDSLIEQVRKLAALQEDIPEGARLECTMYGNVDAALFVQQVSALDCNALLAHMQAQQAVVDAAKKLKQHLVMTYPPSALEISPTGKLLGELGNALAALEKVKP